MSLLGSAVVAIWNDIQPEARAEFYEWHSREHMPERVAIPGFLRGRRYIAEQGQPEWFTLYEVDRPETLAGPDYLARLNAPTEWTQRVVRSFTNVTRSLCRAVVSLGPGAGGYMATLRCDVAPGRAADLDAYLENLVRHAISGAGVHGAHLCRLEAEASSIETAERRSRANATLLAEVVVMIESSVRDPLAAVLHECTRERLTAAGAAEGAPLETGLYRLEFLC
jgi:hypothetical protein